jgi:ATP-binding cassette, subfamily B, bacterial
MKLMLSYLSRYKGLVLLALVLTIVSQVFNFLNPYFLGNFLIDPFAQKAKYFRENGLDAQFYRGVGFGMLLIIGASTICWITKAYQEYIVNVIVQKFGASLYLDVQRHTLSLPYKDFENQVSGQILSVLQRARTDSEKFITRFVHVLFSTAIGIIVVTVIAFQLSPWLPVVYLSGAALLAFFTQRISRKIKFIQKNILDESTALAGSTTESIRNIELVKSLGLTQQEIDRLHNTTERILGNEIKKLKSLRSVGFVYGAFVHTLHQGIIFFLLMFIFHDYITVGQLLMMQIYFYYIFGTLEELGTVIAAYKEAEASLNNLTGILDKPVESLPKNAEQIDSIENLRFEKVCFQHQSATRPALVDISFEVKCGETIAIVGPSGSGKTTLVKLLAGLYTPNRGSIYYNDYNIRKVDFNQLRNQIGLVTQDTQLFSGTIRDNLLFVNNAATDEMINEVLEKAACQDLLARADKGLETLIGEGGLKVSGGERQRLSIARALLRESSLLIFDEATSSLDSLTEEDIACTMRQITNQKKYITIMIAHRLSTIMFADRILVLERGRIIETGNHASLLEEKGLYFAMWRQQTGEWKEVLTA